LFIHFSDAVACVAGFLGKQSRFPVLSAALYLKQYFHTSHSRPLQQLWPQVQDGAMILRVNAIFCNRGCDDLLCSMFRSAFSSVLDLFLASKDVYSPLPKRLA
jgi:hypothetical protein